MLEYMKIKTIKGRQVLDSRGNPTVEATVVVENTVTGEQVAGSAMVPSGASTGIYEAVELRDGGDKYRGLGVMKAVENIEEAIAPSLKDMVVSNQADIDRVLKEIDGTENKSSLGANTMLAVSMAASRAGANAYHMPLYQYLGGLQAKKIPVPMMNILNGGAHSANSLDVQEFMIVPVGTCCIREGIRWCVEIFHTLKAILKAQGCNTSVGDEGGFAPDLESEIEAIDLIMESIEQAGYRPGKDIMISLDIAASEWKSDVKDKYYLPKQRRTYMREELMEEWIALADKYPVFSMEDPMDEDDFDGWKTLTERIGDKTILVGDDLFVTNKKRLEMGIKNHMANAILIKPNQIGTLTETFEAVALAKEYGYKTIMSHRSGETEDAFIADLSVALNTGFIKTGAPSRGERTAKYNRLMKIEELLYENK